MNKNLLTGLTLSICALGGYALLVDADFATAEEGNDLKSVARVEAQIAVPRNRFTVEVEGIAVSERLRARFKSVNSLVSVPGMESVSDLVELSGSHEEMLPLWEWYDSVRDGDLTRRTMSVIVLDGSGNELFRYNIFEVVPVQWSFDSSVLPAGFRPPLGSFEETLTIAAELVELG